MLSVHTSKLQRLVTRLEQASSAGRSVIVFDGDGTLWSGDVGEDLFHYAVEHRLILPGILKKLNTLAEQFDLLRSDDANRQAQLLFEAFEAGQLPEKEACEMMTWCYAGWAVNAFATHVKQALKAKQLAARYFEPLLTLVRWTREQGHKALVVSASPYMVVVEAVRPLGFVPDDVAAGRLICDAGRYTGELAYPLPYADTKVDALRALAGGLPVLAAFGDNVFDLQMLAAAVVPVAVRPKPVLEERLSELADCFVLA